MDNKKNKKKEWFFSIAMLAVMIVGAGISAWQAWEAKESREAAQQSEQRIYELQVGLHTPRLETRRFTSFSTNLADPRDLERLMTNGISLLKVGTSWRDYDDVSNKLYVWLVILNNGEGPTKVVQVESFRYLIDGKTKIGEAVPLYPDGISLRPGQAIGIFLGEIGKWSLEPSGQIVWRLMTLQFESKITVSHGRLMPEPETPAPEELEPPQVWGGEMRYPQEMEPGWL